MNLAKCGMLTFEEPDTKRFRNLALAYEAMHRGGNIPCALNAANEVAVQKFLQEKISFLGMSDMLESVINTINFIDTPSYDDYVATDQKARELAELFVVNH